MVANRRISQNETTVLQMNLTKKPIILHDWLCVLFVIPVIPNLNEAEEDCLFGKSGRLVGSGQYRFSIRAQRRGRDSGSFLYLASVHG
jgi:hypothetical protein